MERNLPSLTPYYGVRVGIDVFDTTTKSLSKHWQLEYLHYNSAAREIGEYH